MEITQSKIFKGDRVLWIVLMLLSLLSLLIVYSSTGALAYRQASGNTWYFLIRQVFFLGAGFGLMLVMVNFLSVRIYSVLANLLIYISIGLLLVTTILKFAGLLQGTGRTLDLGFISFQPAELAKISLIMYTARVLGKNQGTRGQLKKAFIKIISHTVVICGLIFLSNFSTAALLFATIFTMMFAGRISLKYLFIVILLGMTIVAGAYIAADRFPDAPARIHTVKGRIDRFIKGDPNSEKGITQADYAKLAIYEGGIFGKGPGHSNVSNYMASAYNDFIFAIIVEEYGLIIGIMVMFLYLIFFFRSVVIVRRATRTFPAFLVTGLTVLLVYQAMINIGVSTGVLPVTGQPLPWISLGGSSLLFTSVAFGCILSVSYQNQINRETQKPAVQVNMPDEDYEMHK
ncbi:MAG: FtsW/RodA/SpoVE family cell cycle protein [Prolixibacteraceae bacterium]|jgi:cell division protein FtsW|nr:FtsW/RodA/SpoVE family cell cycle protein [Prolixibacteraceae bacterium]MDD4754565.1 FtsW/RodA/SpoVE family cell cycle protein [Prolixibacteraceae bacterium]NLO03419.1 FtsW/RodA/SpoVE family cell cycle protein [Bacteroidales bacterium]